ncbi:MAG: dihydroorotase, partial [Clostridiales bacterium]|nr:dihydroorotase [Clostridiales bacterium]
MDKLIIKGARIIDPTITENDTNDIGNILIVGGRIAGYPEEIGGIDAEMIDASGLVCSPGLVDMHVHLRDPG